MWLTALSFILILKGGLDAWPVNTEFMGMR